MEGETIVVQLRERFLVHYKRWLIEFFSRSSKSHVPARSVYLPAVGQIHTADRSVNVRCFKVHRLSLVTG